MSETIAQWNSWLNGYVWGTPMMVLLIGTGLLLTILTGAIQFRRLPFALKEVLGKVFQRGSGSDVSPFQAVSTALASTVGVREHRRRRHGDLPGRTGRALLAVGLGPARHVHEVRRRSWSRSAREPDASGAMRGGAMYTLKKGLKLPWLGWIIRAPHLGRRPRHRQHGPGQLGRRLAARELRHLAPR